MPGKYKTYSPEFRDEAARLVVARPGFPKPTILDMGRVWDDADVDEWEAAERAAGRALPAPGGGV